MATELERTIINRLLDGWEGALHVSDTYLQIVQTMPDAEQQVRYWANDSLRRETTHARFQVVRELVLAFLEEKVDGSQLQRLLEELNPKVN